MDGWMEGRILTTTLRVSMFLSQYRYHAPYCMFLQGHLFDSGVINRVLDVFDAEATDVGASSSSSSSAFSFSILDISVNTNTTQGPVPSRIVLQLSGPNEEGLQRLVDSIAMLMESHPKADGSIHVTAVNQVESIPT